MFPIYVTRPVILVYHPKLDRILIKDKTPLHSPDSATTLALGRSYSMMSTDSSNSNAGNILREQIEHYMKEYKIATGESFQAT